MNLAQAIADRLCSIAGGVDPSHAMQAQTLRSDIQAALQPYFEADSDDVAGAVASVMQCAIGTAWEDKLPQALVTAIIERWFLQARLDEPDAQVGAVA